MTLKTKPLTGKQGSGKGLTEADLQAITDAVVCGQDSAVTSQGDVWLSWPNFDSDTDFNIRVVAFGYEPEPTDCVASTRLDLETLAGNFEKRAWKYALERSVTLRTELAHMNWAREDRKDLDMLYTWFRQGHDATYKAAQVRDTERRAQRKLVD